MIKNCLEEELKYIYFSKVFYTILITLIFFFLVILFMNYQSVVDINNQYSASIEYYKENNLDIEEDLSQNYSIIKEKEGNTIENPLAYYKSILGQFIYAASPQYTSSQLLEASIIIFPAVFGLFGLFVGSYDLKYKTVKIKGVRFSRLNYALSKQLALLIGSITILTIGLIVSIIFGKIMFVLLRNNINLEPFTVILQKRDLIPKIIFGYVMSILYTKIGYTLGLFFKNIAVGIVVIIGYVYIVPNLGKFDLKNSIQLLAIKVFDFYGIVSVDKYHETKTIYSIFIILVTFIILSIIEYFTIKNRSMYE